MVLRALRSLGEQDIQCEHGVTLSPLQRLNGRYVLPVRKDSPAGKRQRQVKSGCES